MDHFYTNNVGVVMAGAFAALASLGLVLNVRERQHHSKSDFEHTKEMFIPSR